MTIEELRRQVDQLDAQIAELLLKRLILIQKIFEEKKRWGVSLEDRRRESEILNKIKIFSQGDEKKQKFLEDIFQTIIEQGKKI